MKIEKYKSDYPSGVNYYYYYIDNKIFHGLYNSINNKLGIGYCYHGIGKGFWLKNKYWL